MKNEESGVWGSGGFEAGSYYPLPGLQMWWVRCIATGEEWRVFTLREVERIIKTPPGVPGRPLGRFPTPDGTIQPTKAANAS